MIPVILVAGIAETRDDVRYGQRAFRSALLLELLEYIENITHIGTSFSVENQIHCIAFSHINQGARAKVYIEFNNSSATAILSAEFY